MLDAFDPALERNFGVGELAALSRMSFVMGDGAIRTLDELE